MPIQSLTSSPLLLSSSLSLATKAHNRSTSFFTIGGFELRLILLNLLISQAIKNIIMIHEQAPRHKATTLMKATLTRETGKDQNENQKQLQDQHQHQKSAAENLQKNKICMYVITRQEVKCFVSVHPPEREVYSFSRQPSFRQIERRRSCRYE